MRRAFGSICVRAALSAAISSGAEPGPSPALRRARSLRPGNAPADLLCVTAVNPKPYRSSYICFGFVRKAEGREVHSVVKGQTTCHISLPSLATTEGCVKRKKVAVNSSAASFLKNKKSVLIPLPVLLNVSLPLLLAYQTRKSRLCPGFCPLSAKEAASCRFVPCELLGRWLNHLETVTGTVV